MPLRLRMRHTVAGLSLIEPSPSVARCPAMRSGHVGDWATCVDALTQTSTPFWRERGVGVGRHDLRVAATNGGVS